MAQYIDKSALVAEIWKRRTKHFNFGGSPSFEYCHEDDEILRIINTLEVKEVDLEKEYKDFVEEDPVYNKLVNGIVGKAIAKHFFELGLKAQHDNWKVENLWKPADGDDLPDIDREVVVLIKYNAQRNIHDEEYPTYRVGFGHRPNPNGWDGKNIETNEGTHYTPKLYDKGGWNIPNIKYWLDVKLPKEIEL